MKPSVYSILCIISISLCVGLANHVFATENLSVENKDTNATTAGTKPVVTFVELGSVSCIPCKQMQPVMKAIEAKYGEQVKVIFYDVWKEDQKKFSKQYNVRLIPTQVFLDANGKEFSRHEGFYSEKEIDKLLQSKGLRPITGKKG